MIEIPKIVKPQGAEQAPRWFHIAVALSMVLSAGASLVSALRTSATMSNLVEQNARLVRAGSTPILQLTNSNYTRDGKYEIQVTVENAGTGPARIVWMEARYKDQPLKHFGKFLELQANELGIEVQGNQGLFTVTGSVAGDVLSAGRERRLWSWPRPDKAEAVAHRLWMGTDRARGAISYEACYCSVFDECWTTRFDDELPKAVARCEAKGHTNINGG
ncbi:hypothetical protein RQP53_15200 [Paucibacter sp. APW11]|uniref:CARDB domain-containing protein n=1 Tax=Roseateles aquae TaxID=3077235 RepID=A0ABU3PE56_9BURK|nr:hypothetical protein [Paucibacter sp. APW11]MDT9000620.1 hypothetical protein [Paucibacter sp. APW11]